MRAENEKKLGKQVVYQVYPKSFQDSNGDGLGDIRGIISRLDYLKELGVDYIWSTPVFVSPQNDNGYDVADYYEIDPAYGTMEDLETLIDEAGKRGMGLMLDMVFNHTSTAHPWFQKALSGDPVYQDFYIWRKGKENGEPPTNWVSKFGGSAWEYVPELGQYYLHLFDRTQADLNWDNPLVREELIKILKFWMEKGVKGFRFDVVNLISKPEQFADDETGDGRRFYTDGPHVHEYLKEICQKSGLWEQGMMTVGEMSSTSMENCIRYSNPAEQELSMCFHFHHLKVDYHNQEKWELAPMDFFRLKELLCSWQEGMQDAGGWSALFWCNHDQPRIVSRFGDDGVYRKESAKMLATAIHMLRGTPYIYQGEEIGMTNAGFTDISSYRDVESIHYFHILKEKGLDEGEIYRILGARSRDNSRTPMQWDGGTFAGFSTGEPWISVNENHREINVEESRKDGDSVLAYYQELIRLRKTWDVISDGTFEAVLRDHPSVFACKRHGNGQELLVLCNFFGEETVAELSGVVSEEDLARAKRLIGNYPQNEQDELTGEHLRLRPYEAVVFLIEG